MAAKTKVRSIPGTLAECADLLYETRDERLAEQKKVDEIEAFEKALKAHLIDNLPKSNASGVAGKVANAKIVAKMVPTLKDWKKLEAHIKKTGDFDLIQHRLSSEAIFSRWEDKKKVPGVEAFQTFSVSVTKV